MAPVLLWEHGLETTSVGSVEPWIACDDAIAAEPLAASPNFPVFTDLETSEDAIPRMQLLWKQGLHRYSIGAS